MLIIFILCPLNNFLLNFVLVSEQRAVGLTCRWLTIDCYRAKPATDHHQSAALLRYSSQTNHWPPLNTLLVCTSSPNLHHSSITHKSPHQLTNNTPPRNIETRNIIYYRRASCRFRQTPSPPKIKKLDKTCWRRDRRSSRLRPTK
jgi:hypothetical protein